MVLMCGCLCAAIQAWVWIHGLSMILVSAICVVLVLSMIDCHIIAKKCGNEPAFWGVPGLSPVPLVILFAMMSESG